MSFIQDAPVFRLAKDQCGVVAYHQLAALGVTRARLRNRLMTGEWIRALPSVVRLYWADETWMQKVWVAWLWAGPVSFVSHLSAAQLLGFNVPVQEVVHVVAPLRFQLRSSTSWVRAHRATSLSAVDSRKLKGLPVTSPARTLVDLASVLEPKALAAVAEDALASGLVAFRELKPFFKRSRGKQGFSVLRRCLRNLN
jgi:hypothetical protein